MPTPRIALVLSLGLGSVAAAQDLGSLGPKRPPLAFDAARDQPGVLRVKFREGLDVRLRQGLPRRLATLEPAVDPTRFPGSWRRTHAAREERLAELHARAEARLGRDVADHNLELDYLYDTAADPDALIERFHAHPLVEYALPARKPVAPPLPGDYEDEQGYLDAATDGVGADEVRA